MAQSEVDERHMRRAMDLAMRGRGWVEPNPMVGCVIVRDDTIVGEGYHRQYGTPHAEPNAIHAAGHHARGATAYVTLEPCSHEWPGKLNPACTPQLVEAGVTRVVVGSVDHNPKISGKGIELLRAAGIDVTVGVLGRACEQMIAAFLCRVTRERPYVTMKWAQSADGFVAGRAGKRVQISNESSSRAVHWLRGRCDAIAVGTNTVVNDDPMLTARTPSPPKLPTRVVFSNGLNLPPDARLWIQSHTPTLVYTTADRGDSRAAPLLEQGVELVQLPAKNNGRGGKRFDLDDAYRDLWRRGITHLLIEPGPKLAADLIKTNRWDRAWVIESPNTIGGDGLAAPRLEADAVADTKLEGDVLREYLNEQSDAFFGRHASVDFLHVAGELAVDKIPGKSGRQYDPA